MPVFPNAGTHQDTSYRVPDTIRAWVEKELNDYLNPQHWDSCREKDGKSMWKKNFAASGKKEPSKLKNLAYWKFSAIIPDATQQDIYDIMHQHGAKYQPYLTEGFIMNELVEVIPESRRGSWCDEAVVQYRSFKLPIVNARDFLTLTIQKNFVTPSGASGIGLFTRSVPDYPVDYPVKKGVTRAELLSCCAFLLPAATGCHYTLTQRANIHLALPLPAAVTQYGEKSHIWRHFDVMRRCVAIHHEHLKAGAVLSPTLEGLQGLPPTISQERLEEASKSIEQGGAPTEDEGNTIGTPPNLQLSSSSGGNNSNPVYSF